MYRYLSLSLCLCIHIYIILRFHVMFSEARSKTIMCGDKKSAGLEPT